MPAYVIAKIHVTDAEIFERYKLLSSAAVDAHGCRFLIRGGHFEAVEGIWPPERMTVIEFPSWESAMSYVSSDEYGRARTVRRDAASVDMIVVHGVGSCSCSRSS